MGRFISKKLNDRKPSVRMVKSIFSDETTIKEDIKNENNIKKNNEEVMTTSEKINAVNNVLNSETVKKIKRDKGLIERTESSKTILTEDNKELLKD